MKEPEAAIFSGCLLQAHKDLGSIRNAVAGMGMPHASARMRLQRLGQPHSSKRRRPVSLSALVGMVAYGSDRLGLRRHALLSIPTGMAEHTRCCTMLPS